MIISEILCCCANCFYECEKGDGSKACNRDENGECLCIAVGDVYSSESEDLYKEVDGVVYRKMYKQLYYNFFKLKESLRYDFLNEEDFEL